MTVRELKALLESAMAVDPEMEVCVRWIEDDCTHIGGIRTASPEYGCTDRQAFIVDGDEKIAPPEGYDDFDPARPGPS